MATLNNLETRGKLVLYEADLQAGEQKERNLYLAPSFPEWLEDYLDFQPKDRGRDLFPSEQVEEIFDQFVRGHPNMGRADMRKLTPLAKHVWEFKPTDVRIFGYFYRSNSFIAVCGEMKNKLTPDEKEKYRPFIDKVVDFRNKLNADEPKCMEERELHALISL